MCENQLARLSSSNSGLPVTGISENWPKSLIQGLGWCVCLNPRIRFAVYVYCHPSPIFPVWGVQKFIPQGRAVTG